MTALALPNAKKLWLPKFEPWRLLRPLKLDGVFQPFHPMHFMEGVLDPVDGGWGSVPTVSMGTQATLTADSTNYTFNSFAVNCAVGDLVVIMDMNSGVGGGTTSSSMTIAGNAMTLVKKTTVNNNENSAIYQWVATSALTTTTVVSNHGSGSSRDSIVPFIIQGLASTTAVDGQSTQNTSANSLSVNLTVSADGIVIGGYQQANGNGSACTWSGMTNVTKQIDFAQEATATASVAMGSQVPAYTAQALNASCGAAAAAACMVAASWR